MVMISKLMGTPIDNISKVMGVSKFALSKIMGLVSSTPIQDVLALAGLASITPDCSRMFYPNDPSRSSGNRQHLYKRGVGWTDAYTTLSRPSAKYDVINGVLTTIPAGELGKNGRIEPAATNLLAYTADMDNAVWTKGNTGAGSADPVITNGQPDPLGGTKAVRVQFVRGDIDAGSYSQVYQSSTCTPQLVSVWMRSRVGTPKVSLWAYDASTQCTVTSSWQKFTASIASGTFGFVLSIHKTKGDAVTADIDIYCPMLEQATYATTSVPSEGAVSTTRAADALSYADDFSGLQLNGSVLQISRLATSSGRLVALRGSGGRRADITIINATTVAFYAQSAQANVTATCESGSIVAAVQAWDSTTRRVCANGTTAAQGIGDNIIPTVLELNQYVATPSGHEALLTLVFDRKLTDAEMQALTSSAFRTAIAAGL